MKNKQLKTLLAVALSAALVSPVLAADKIALVVKSLGNGFFDAANQGAQEAAKELKKCGSDLHRPGQGDGRRAD
jgi:rhamnose transport system substrate-binding protein